MVDKRRLRGAAVTIVLLGGLPSASADSPSVEEQPPSIRILAPTLGRPVFVAPGESFVLRVVAPTGTTRVDCALVQDRWPQRRIPLGAVSGAAVQLSAGEPLRLTIPAGTPPQTYDLELRVGASLARSRHSVSVGAVDSRVRLVHLSNMNIGDLSAPQFDHRLVTEVNLIAPTAIVMTGDILDATHASPRAGWDEFVEWASRLDAPIVLACGDHDPIDLYSEWAAPSPIGSIQIGRHRAVVLFDHPGAPIGRDADQARWVESLLRQPAADGLTFVVTHDDFPALLSRWRAAGVLTPMVQTGRLGLWIAGGHSDWDGVEHADIVSAAAPMRYVRTHQASHATLGGATGVSHYRVIDVDGDRMREPGELTDAGKRAPSIAVGHLRAAVDGANDGSRALVSFEATSTLARPVERLALWARVGKTGTNKPWCRGGRIDATVEHPRFWECRVRFDLPDKCALRGQVGTGAPPPESDLSVRFPIGEVLEFRERRTRDGLRYWSAVEPLTAVELTNPGATSTQVTPQIRLDGEPLAYRTAGEGGPFLRRMSLTLPPATTVRLQVDLSVVRVSPGRRTLQVYAGDASAFVPFVHPIDVRVVP